MAFAIGNVRLQVKETGRTVTIPNDPRAKLMYYLDCVCSALALDSSDTQNIERLRDYQNYRYLNEEQKSELLILCAMISPDVLLNKVFFQNDEMCGDKSNNFYEIGTISNRMLVSRSIVIGGQTRNIRKIMTFKMDWLRNYYITPMQAIAREMEEAEERRRRAIAARRRNDDSCIIL
ncbi:uncharacterized protein LOC134280693 [Saccostrea cucullata]|uniref:uncharacterized protein LOC134280693 n=1 Tax=Saccostrea cuccullata TaxID=36930 RepID=UPI002ED5B678